MTYLVILLGYTLMICLYRVSNKIFTILTIRPTPLLLLMMHLFKFRVLEF